MLYDVSGNKSTCLGARQELAQHGAGDGEGSGGWGDGHNRGPWSSGGMKDTPEVGSSGGYNWKSPSTDLFGRFSVCRKQEPLCSCRWYPSLGLRWLFLCRLPQGRHHPNHLPPLMVPHQTLSCPVPICSLQLLIQDTLPSRWGQPGRGCDHVARSTVSVISLSIFLSLGPWYPPGPMT